MGAVVYTLNRVFDAARVVVAVALPAVPLVAIAFWGPNQNPAANLLLGVLVAAGMLIVVVAASSVRASFRRQSQTAALDTQEPLAYFAARLDRGSYKRLKHVFARQGLQYQGSGPLLVVATSTHFQLWAASPDVLALALPWGAVRDVAVDFARFRAPRVRLLGGDPMPLTLVAAQAGLFSQRRGLTRATDVFAAKARDLPSR
jgi:hypothetical protein